MRPLFLCFISIFLWSCAQTGPTEFTMDENTLDEFFDGKGEPDNPLVVPNPDRADPSVRTSLQPKTGK